MNNSEIYKALRMIVKTYISESNQEELLKILGDCELEGRFPLGKGILACVSSDSNGVRFKPEHKDLWDEICHHCI